MSSELSNRPSPVVLKDVRVTATIVNEDGHEFPMNFEIKGACTAELSSNRDFERIFGEDGKVLGFWPGSVEHKFVFRHNPLAQQHPELMKTGRLEPPDENGWSKYVPPEEETP